MTDNNPPSLEQWRTLYDLAEKVKTLKPWEWMQEDDIFGVEEPQSKALGFVSVMGMAGEHPSVSIYRGIGSLYAIWEFMDNAFFVNPMDLLQIPQLQVAFEDRDQVWDEDRAVMKALNLKFKGRKGWTTFRDYTPGFLPWLIKADDVPMLTCALEQLLDVAPRFKADPKVLFPDAPDNYFELMQQPPKLMFDPSSLIQNTPSGKPLFIPEDAFEFDEFDEAEEDDSPPTIMIRTQKEPGTWQDDHRELTLPEPRTLMAIVDPTLIAKIQKFPKGNKVWEVDLMMLPSPVSEPDSRPYFPFLLIGADAKSGMVNLYELMQPLPDRESMYESVPNTFLNALVKMNIKPKTIRLDSPLVHMLIEPIATTLKFKLEFTEDLPALEAAEEGIVGMLMGDFDDFLPEDLP